MHIALVRVAAVAALLSPGLFTVGCGSDSTKSDTATTSTQATSGQGLPSTNSAQASGGDCPATTSVAVESKNGGYPNDLNWSTVYTAANRPIAGLGGDGKAIVVYISTTKRPVSELSSKKVELAPGEAFLRLEFTNGAQDAGSGDYTTSAKPSDPNTFSLSIKVTGRTTVQMSQAKGSAHLVANGDHLCGKFDISDRWTSASGSFAADIAT